MKKKNNGIIVHMGTFTQAEYEALRAQAPDGVFFGGSGSGWNGNRHTTKNCFVVAQLGHKTAARKWAAANKK